MANSPWGCKHLWEPPRGAGEVKQPGWAVFYPASPAAATGNSRAVPHSISYAFCFIANKAKLKCELGELHPAKKLMDLRGVNLHQIKCWNRGWKLSDCCAGCWLSSRSLHDLSPAVRCFLSFPLGTPTQAGLWPGPACHACLWLQGQQELGTGSRDGCKLAKPVVSSQSGAGYRNPGTIHCRCDL